MPSSLKVGREDNPRPPRYYIEDAPGHHRSVEEVSYEPQTTKALVL